MDLKECIINLNKSRKSLEAILKQLQVPISTEQTIISIKCMAQFCHCHNQKEIADYPLLLRQNGSGSCRVKQKLQGCFAASGSAALNQVNVIMNKNDYHQILLQDNLKSSAMRLGLGGSWVFQQKRCRGMANQARFTVGFWLNWPVQSPNLNPIETCGLKKQLGAKKLANLVNFT